MDYLTYLKKLEAISYLAERKRTGCPKELAGKLDVSERTILRMIRRLKEMGVPIEFSRTRNSYVMEETYEQVFPLPESGSELL